MKIFFLFSSLSAVFATANAQQARLREGNAYYGQKKYADAAKKYNDALKKDDKSYEGNYNLGNTLYEEGKFEDAGKKLQQAYAGTQEKAAKANAMYNLGNACLARNKLEEAIKAYKQSLLDRPGDKDAAYNLSY